MKWLAFTGSLLVLVISACSPSYTTCKESYNCPPQSSCVAGVCVQGSSEASANDGGLDPERLVWANDDGTISLPESSKATTCQSKDQCTQESQPHCWKERCVSGYLEFKFQKGHFVIERDKPVKACAETSECSKWQQCHLGFCRDNVGTQSEATGKLLDAGLFLGEYSFSELGQRGKEDVVRIVMVGTFSEKLQKHLIIEIPQDQFTLGNHEIDGTSISATLREVQLDLVPRRSKTVAYAVSGSIRILYAGLNPGDKVAGTATLQLKPLSL